MAMFMNEIVSIVVAFEKTKKPGQNEPPGVRSLAFI
jgi:hypothetical protein